MKVCLREYGLKGFLYIVVWGGNWCYWGVIDSMQNMKMLIFIFLILINFNFQKFYEFRVNIKIYVIVCIGKKMKFYNCFYIESYKINSIFIEKIKQIYFYVFLQIEMFIV